MSVNELTTASTKTLIGPSPDSQRQIRSRPAPDSGSTLGGALPRHHLALRLSHQLFRIHRPLDVFRILLRPHAAHSHFQRRLLHDTPYLDRPRRGRVSPLLPAGRDLRFASGGFLRIDPAALPDSEGHREPTGGAAGDHHDGVPFLLFVERGLALHRRRWQHVRPAHARLPCVRRAFQLSEVVAGGRRRTRREDGVLPILSNFFLPAGLRLLLLRATRNGPSPVHRGMEALRVGIRFRHRALRPLQHGHQRPFSFLHQLRGNGRENCHSSQPLQRFHLRLDRRRHLVDRPRTRNGGRDRLRLTTTKPLVDSEYRFPFVLAAISSPQCRDYDSLAVGRAACLAAPHLCELPHACGLPRPRLTNCHRHARA